MAQISISPAVQFSETDLTAVVPVVASSIGAFAGEFTWGPSNDPTTISNEGELSAIFGKPTDKTYTSFFSVKNFLDYSGNILVVRAETTGQMNATASGSGAKVSNLADYEANHDSGENSVGMWAAKFPGALGNSLKVSLCDRNSWERNITPGAATIAVTADSAVITGTSTTFLSTVSVGDTIVVTVSAVEYRKRVVSIASDTSLTVSSVFPVAGSALEAVARWEYQNLFSGAPIDSNEAIAMGSSNDGLHIVVVDEDGKFTGTAGQVLEVYDNLFKSPNSMRFDGTSGYYKTALKNSSWIWWMDHPISTQVNGTGTDFGAPIVANVAYDTLNAPISVSLINGADGAKATDGELQTAFGLFANAEKYDVSLVITGHVSANVQKFVLQNVAETRMDCVAFVSPFDPSDGSFVVGDKPENIAKLKTYYTTNLNVSTSYGFCDSGVKYQYDKYNDVYRWVPMNADMAGLCARTDYIAEAWFAPAGLNRGSIKNCIKLGINPDKTDRDELFKVNINPVVSFPGQGIVLFGDKTMQARPSAFDAINVRRLFIILEKSISTAAKYFLFEQNDAITQQLFVNMVTPFLRGIKGRRGIDDFLVDVGPTVNTAEVLNLRQFRGNIYVRPVGAIRNIALNFIATPYGVDFTEYTLA